MGSFKQKLLCLFFFIVVVCGGYGQNAQFVNPFIGTGKCNVSTLWGNYGGTYPGATAPWGMVQLTPETSIRPSESGYYYEDSSIRSFSCLHHLSGFPNGSSGYLHLAFLKGRVNKLASDFSGRAFSHAKEQAIPGYYGVSFTDGDRVEMTASVHSGLFRYSSSSDTTTVVIWGAGNLNIRDSQTVMGSFMHSLVHFQTPFYAYEIKNDTAYLHFAGKHAERQLMAAVSASASGVEKSEMNRVVEIPGWDFEQLKSQTYDAWNRELSCVEVQSDDVEAICQFYTALYHSFLYPNIVSDADGTYKGRQVAWGRMYGNFSPWDTFRTLHPLLSLLKPDRQKEMICSLMEEYESNGMFPSAPMTGLHYAPLLVDACFKDAADVDERKLWDALMAYQQAEFAGAFGKEYNQRGFIDASLEKSVSVTTEYVYDDWVLGRLAEKVGEDVTSYWERARNYQNLFDVETCFLLPRGKDGFLRKSGELGFQESTKWTASCFAPHDVAGLIHLWGGDSCFVAWLEQAFDKGRIVFDNEPVFHYPYLFTWAGRPDITRRYVHQILRESYSNTPGGLPGNDDLGSMSSWFAFSAMGIFPACPGSDEYLLTEPLFDKVRIFRSGNIELEIKKNDTAFSSDRLPFVCLGGKRISRWFVSHHEWMREKVISFEESDSSGEKSVQKRPYSLTKDAPEFEVSSVRLVDSVMCSGGLNAFLFTVKNKGSVGSYLAQTALENRYNASMRILLEANQEKADTLVFSLYREGIHTLSFAGREYAVQVLDSVRRTSPLFCTSISLPSLWKSGEQVEGLFVCKNVSGKRGTYSVPLYLGDTLVETKSLVLEPGEEQTLCFSLCVNRAGMYKVRLLDKEKRVKVYSKAQEACVLDLDYGRRKGQCIPDNSGFGNNGTACGDLQWGPNCVQTGDCSYIILPATESLMETREGLTLLTWIAPQAPVKSHTYADFFTKGDYTLMKMEGPQSLVFFAGGWGRGMCEVRVPSDWYTAWHQIAGVCTGDSLKFYIDGRCVQEIAVSGRLEETEVSWNIGRNAEMPFSRFSDMKFGRTRIYGAALSDDDIEALYHAEKDCFR